MGYGVCTLVQNKKQQNTSITERSETVQKPFRMRSETFLKVSETFISL